MPSFNDLYFNFIGNTNLKPEEAHVTNLRISYDELGTNKRVQFEVHVDGYFNQVNNKIIAIPTKDLFNWSMQNVGITEAFGFDFAGTIAFQKKNWVSSMTTSHSLNSTIDISNPSGPSYGHQLPYTPRYSSSNTFLISYFGYGISVNALYSGKRYSLNENITSNLLDPYVDLNVGIQKAFEFKNDIELGVSLKAMNVLNKNYEIIRSFPMPGRYYQFTLNFSYK